MIKFHVLRVAILLIVLVCPDAWAQEKKPNVLVIFGDDVGQTNISTYSFGVVGYRTPNLDRLAKEGMMFTDYYAENSCTDGRSTFITGQSPLRTGLSSELDFYNLGLADLAEKCDLSQPKALAVVRHLNLQQSSDYFKEVRIGKSTFKGYSPQALDAVRKALPGLDFDTVWSEHGPGRGAKTT